MTSLQDKVVVVTGASAGIGKALVYRLINAGAVVIGCARNLDVLLQMAEKINGTGSKKMHPVKCDVTEEESLVNVFKYVEEQCGNLHALVNNAGMALPEPILSGNSEGWMTMLQTNVMSVAMGSREAYKLMRKLEVDDGHIINVSSMASHRVLNNSNTHFYDGTKHAVRAITEGLRQELRNENTHIRVTQISPALVRTEFVERMTDSKKSRGIVFTLPIFGGGGCRGRDHVRITSAPARKRIGYLSSSNGRKFVID